MPQDDLTRLRHMLDSAQEAVRFNTGEEPRRPGYETGS